MQVPPHSERLVREPGAMHEEIDLGLGQELLEFTGARQPIMFSKR
jgi:hypothetical protein